VIDFPLDTNVLFYAMDRDAGKRHKLAMKIVDRASVFDRVLILQSLSYCPLSFETLHGFARSLILFGEENNTPRAGGSGSGLRWTRRNAPGALWFPRA
jgi:hypothetical protein